MTILIAPSRPGLIVRYPGAAQPLPAEGLAVELDSFWQRRLTDGDCVIVPDAPPAAAPKTKPAPTE